MNKSAFSRELGSRLGFRMTRQMLDKYHMRGMPLNSIDSALEWLAANSIGKPGRRAREITKRGEPQVVISLPVTANLQPADSCGAMRPDPSLTADDGASFYEATLTDADIVALSQVLQRRVPELVCCSPAMAEAVQRAIRETICTWSGGMACPHCRGEAGIVDPTDPGALAA